MNKTAIKSISQSLALAASIMAVGTSALADHDRHQANVIDEGYAHIAYGKVIKVTPVYREVKTTTPVKQCWQEPVTRSHSVGHGSHTAGSTLAGGLIGGIIGHQFGKGRGKKLSTAMGTLIGAQLGHDAARGSHAKEYRYTSYEDICEVENRVSYEEVLDSYKVTYKYNGKKYKVNMPYDPGKRIKLEVSVNPVF